MLSASFFFFFFFIERCERSSLKKGGRKRDGEGNE
jgi:hypothetical protein